MEKRVPLWVAIVIILVVAAVALTVILKSVAQPEVATGGIPASTSTPNTTGTAPNVSTPGGPCVGNIAHPLSCPDGYQCEPAPNSHLPFGDVGGLCVQAEASATVPMQPMVGCTTVNGHTVCY